MKTNKILPVFLLLFLLGGCSRNEVGAKAAFSLDDAIAKARGQCSGDIYDCYSYWDDLEKLWNQAEGDEKQLVEQEMLTSLVKRLEVYGDPMGRTSAALRALGELATSDAVRKAAGEALVEYERAQEAKAKQEQKEQEERQAQEQKKAEEIRLAFHESRDRLIRTAAGRLNDKSAEEVKKLLDDWTPQKDDSTQFGWFLLEFLPKLNEEELREYFGADIFYRAFGQPQRKQFISSEGVYYFYYECKDGMVQIEVPAAVLSEKNVILVSDLNIF